jgi:Zn-dependent M28 family amino/carboxypeptidase
MAYLIDYLGSLPGVTVTTELIVATQSNDDITIPKLYNVIATLAGDGKSSDKIVIGAHYDSISEDPTRNGAPGAVDNATGTAAVLEIITLMANLKVNTTAIEFILFSGEEIGYLGSIENANNKDAHNIKFMINMDMIGWRDYEDKNFIEVESDLDYEPYLLLWKEIASECCTLPCTLSVTPFGSDHLPYLKKKIPSLLTINKDGAQKYVAYHTSNDVIQNVDIPIAREFVPLACCFYLIITFTDRFQLIIV